MNVINRTAPENLREKHIEILKKKQSTLFLNHEFKISEETTEASNPRESDIQHAACLLDRFAPLLTDLFPELAKTNGIIESELTPIKDMGRRLSELAGVDLKGSYWIKGDHALPVAGSIKARGGIFEVLAFAEKLAFENELLTESGDYRLLKSDKARELFGRYTVTVGSTGNLGLSIGVAARALGFAACVHMSSDAKTWKKERLTQRGVQVIEHRADYSEAVRAGREEAESDPYGYFVDDENSRSLFLGYSVAALRLKQQIEKAGLTVDAEHPLFVYLPCGVGGAPGGITFGLKHVFGDSVHCFFAEPVESPCMTLAMLHQFARYPSVYEIQLSNTTEADGLAVGRASELVGDIIKNMLSGSFTVPDDDLFLYLYLLKEIEDIQIEPSAAAGFAGPGLLFGSEAGQAYLADGDLFNALENAAHIIWTTGGSFVPAAEYEKFYRKGLKISSPNNG